MIECKVKAKNCRSRKHGVATKRKATGWLTDHPLNAHNGNDLR